MYIDWFAMDSEYRSHIYLLDTAEQIALDALWKEYVKETNEINSTGNLCEDDSTGESYN